MSVFQLPLLVDKLPPRERALFKRIYETDNLPGRLELPEGMRDWAAERFGSVGEVENQRIMRVTNLVTGEGALFNHLRGRRPLGARQSRDLDSLVEEQRQGCPFCAPGERTPRDLFGRIRGEHCITAANVAKYDGYHGLVIPREHHPLKFDEAMVEDYFQVAARWFLAAHRHAAGESDGAARYPFLMWNCLWPAGSSVVHGHLQLTLTRGRHYPRVDWLRRCARQYARDYGDDYFEDLFALHRALGLGWMENGCRLLAVLTPIKEKETWIFLPPGPVTPERLGGAGRAVGGVLNRLIKKAGLSSFNAALYLPPLAGDDGEWAQFPLIARLVDRGSVFNRTADFGAMELYAASVIASDPFAVARLLRLGKG